MKQLGLFLATCLSASAQADVDLILALPNASTNAPAGGTVTFDNVSPGAGGANSTGGETPPIVFTFPATNGAVANACQFVGVTLSDTASLTVTGVFCVTATSTQAFTKAAHVLPNNTAGSGWIGLWYLVAPPTGTNLVRVYAPSGPTHSVVGGSVTLYNVNQATPISTVTTNAGNTTGPTVTVGGSGATDMVIGVIGDGQAITASGQTLRWQNNHDASTGAGNAIMQTVAGGGAGTISATTAGADYWGAVAVQVNHD